MEAMEVLLQPDVGVNGLGDIVSKPPFTAYRLSQPHAAKSSCGATPLAHQVQLRVAEEKARSSAFPQLAPLASLHKSNLIAFLPFNLPSKNTEKEVRDVLIAPSHPCLLR